MEKSFLDAVYGVAGDRDVKSFYDAWSESYDTEVAANGYATPLRAAQALLACNTPLDARILDFGCGTGLSGAAFAYCGYTILDGTDLSGEMLAIAESKQIYGQLWTTDPSAPLPIVPGDYAVIAAVGVVSPGAAPAAMLMTLSDLLAPGGRLVFSFNDHALANPAFPAMLDSCRASGRMTTLFEEYGPHLPERDLKSTVYVLEKA